MRANDVLGHRAAPELEPAVEVGGGLGQHGATQQHERAPDDPARQRLALAEPGPRGQARAHDDVGVLEQREHRRQRRQRGRAVGVAVQAQLAAGGEHAPAHRVALAAIALVAQELDALAVDQRLHRGGGAVVGGVVDDEELERPWVARLQPVAQGGRRCRRSRVPRCTRAPPRRSRGGPRGRLYGGIGR